MKRRFRLLLGILLSVVVAFTIGAIGSMDFYDFYYPIILRRKATWAGALVRWCGTFCDYLFHFDERYQRNSVCEVKVSISSVVLPLRIFWKINGFQLLRQTLCFGLYFHIYLMGFAKVNIYKLIIGVGTFALGAWLLPETIWSISLGYLLRPGSRTKLGKPLVFLRLNSAWRYSPKKSRPLPCSCSYRA